MTRPAPTPRCEHCHAPLTGRAGRSKLVGVTACSHTCHKARLNTKMVRGAGLHDMLVEWRGDYKKRYLLTAIGRKVARWIEEDAKE